MALKLVVKLNPSLESKLASLQEAKRANSRLKSQDKNLVLLALADAISNKAPQILSANQQDLDRLDPHTLDSFRDRLKLTDSRIQAIVESLRQVAALADPVGELVHQQILSNGLSLRKVRAPLGVLFMIFESRPNIILEAFSLAFKSGNVIILRGGSESKFTAKAIYETMREVFQKSGWVTLPFLALEDYDRAVVDHLLTRNKLIDVVIPRGGAKLIEHVQNTATMPIIKNDRGLCHVYVDDEAEIEMAVQIVQNAKVQRPGVCNSMETVLVHKNIAAIFLPALYKATTPDKLRWHADQNTLNILKDQKNINLAQDADWDTEYLDLIMNCKVVDDLDAALKHIAQHGSRHSEAIVTKSKVKALQFQDEVDAAVVYWNASTRFTDGFEFGLGGELGISTQKLHVRGPVGLNELTTPRWIVDGTGQIR